MELSMKMSNEQFATYLRENFAIVDTCSIKNVARGVVVGWFERNGCD